MPSPQKSAYLLAVNGFADWEPAHAMAELRRSGGYRIEVVGLTMDPVESMGGIHVQPTRALADISADDMAVFIVPGGSRWENDPPEPALVAMLEKLMDAGVPVAAICAGTVALTRAGLLRGRRHTSNGLAYLQRQVPEYTGAADYVDAPAVRDRGLITATGLADVEFAREIFAELDVFSETVRTRWAELFRSGRIPSAKPGGKEVIPAREAMNSTDDS
jgi:putative intracellular protease/amidase